MDERSNPATPSGDAPSAPAVETASALDTKGSAAPELKENAREEVAGSIIQFIRVARQRIPEERIRGDVRITPKGLFIHKDSLPVVMDCYQRWFHEVAPHVHEPGDAKILKRMFGTTRPTLFYLIEPKRALVGHLIECAVQNPQQFGLPVYLGSLEEGTRRIHARDPILQCMPQLEVDQRSEGVTFSLRVGNRAVHFNEGLLQLFARVAERHRDFAHFFAEGPLPLREVLRLLVERLSAARFAPPNQRLLLPFRILRERKVECLVDGQMFWPVRENGAIDTIIDREPRNLSGFVRSELRSWSQGTGPRSLSIAGAGQFFPPRGSRGGRDEYAGEFRFFGKSYALDPHALLQFVKSVLRTAPDPEDSSVAASLAAGIVNTKVPPRPTQSVASNSSRPRGPDWQRFSVIDCVAELGKLFLSAESIDASRIERFIAPHRHAQYRMIGRWVFEVSERGVITQCADKLLGEQATRPRGQGAERRGGRRPRQGR